MNEVRRCISMLTLTPFLLSRPDRNYAFRDVEPCIEKRDKHTETRWWDDSVQVPPSWHYSMNPFR